MKVTNIYRESHRTEEQKAKEKEIRDLRSRPDIVKEKPCRPRRSGGKSSLGKEQGKQRQIGNSLRYLATDRCDITRTWDHCRMGRSQRWARGSVRLARRQNRARIPGRR